MGYFTNGEDETFSHNHAILKITLTAFLGARVEDVMNEEGEIEKCVCIPLDRNNLKEGDTGKVNAYGFVNKTLNASASGWTHYIKQKTDKEHTLKLSELGYKIPFIGNIKPSNFVVNKNAYEEKLKGKKVSKSNYE